MSALGQKRTFAGKFATLGSGYLDVARNAYATMTTPSTVRSKTSIEPSPSSREKLKYRSIKSIGTGLLSRAQYSAAP